MLVNAYSTLLSPPDSPFPSKTIESDPDHLNGFIGFIMRDKPQMTQALYHTMRHIQRVRRQFSFELPEGQQDACSRWAAEANAIFFLPDGTVTDPSFRVLVEPKGVGNPEARVPYPPDAWARKLRSEEILRGRGVPVLEALPPVLGEGEVVLRTPAEVSERIQALLVVAARAYALSSQEPPPSLQAASLSPAEQAFMSEEAPLQQAAQLVWRWEAVRALLWSQGRGPLGWPNDTADLDEIRRDCEQTTDVERPVTEILDALDLHVRLHWAAREANQRKTPLPGVNPSVVMERHYAFNWLTRFEDSDWDDVDTPT